MAEEVSARLLELVGPSDFAHLTEALALGLGRVGTKAELERVFEWVNETWTAWSVYTLITEGSIEIAFQDDGELIFRQRSGPDGPPQ